MTLFSAHEFYPAIQIKTHFDNAHFILILTSAEELVTAESPTDFVMCLTARLIFYVEPQTFRC